MLTSFQSVDKVRHISAGFLIYKEFQSQRFQDFETLFWYNKSIKKVVVTTYDDTECG